jgi:hypothetical protein
MMMMMMSENSVTLSASNVIYVQPRAGVTPGDRLCVSRIVQYQPKVALIFDLACRTSMSMKDFPYKNENVSQNFKPIEVLLAIRRKLLINDDGSCR